MNKYFRQTLLFIVLWSASAFIAAQDIAAQDKPLNSSASIADDVQSLKQQVIDLNRELFVLEEELLYPDNNQIGIFVSMDVGQFCQLDAINVKIDDKDISHYLYTQKQVDALFRGGVQRLYVGNIKPGKHEISAFLVGKGPQGRDFRRAVAYRFEKSSDIKYLQLKISDSSQLHQPVFEVKEWP